MKFNGDIYRKSRNKCFSLCYNLFDGISIKILLHINLSDKSLLNAYITKYNTRLRNKKSLKFIRIKLEEKGKVIFEFYL